MNQHTIEMAGEYPICPNCNEVMELKDAKGNFYHSVHYSDCRTVVHFPKSTASPAPAPSPWDTAHID